MSNPQQNDPRSASRGGLWHRLWAPRGDGKSGMDTSGGSTDEIQLPPDDLSPGWDSLPGDSDTADLTQAAHASPTEAMEPPDVEAIALPELRCAQCAAPLKLNDTFCSDCGFVIVKHKPEPRVPVPRVESAPQWHERYPPERSLTSRPSVQRWLAVARQEDEQPEVEVYYSLAKTAPLETESQAADDDMVNLQAPLKPMHHAGAPVHISADALHWPGARWLHQIVSRMPLRFPHVREYTEEGVDEILVLDPPEGVLLWDAWDHAGSIAERFRLMREVAELLQELHHHQVIVEALRPEMFVVTPEGRVVMADVTELLPVPVPSTAQMKGSLSTAPDLVLAPELADAKVDLYPFGAMVYALHHGRELTDLDFDAYGVPRSFVSIFPDGHPLFTQVILKTFTRFAEQRYPSQDEDSDQSGFTELINQLKAGERSAVGLRLDVSGWSSTGLARATNEDAFAIFHASGFEEDRWGDHALVILADGMGGCNAGEVASALAIKNIRETLCSKSPWTVFNSRDPSKPLAWNEDALLHDMHDAIELANSTIHAAAEQGDGTQIGMGCTCEAGFFMQGHLFMGHVGDSRTYLYRTGHLQLLTQDQTLVNRMVAMGVITADEAEQHPRRHELDQALGSSHPVEIQLISEKLQAGDILVFCSDGLTTHVNDRAISEVLRNTASAEAASRRLVNLANALGGSDNVTVVVVRVA